MWLVSINYLQQSDPAFIVPLWQFLLSVWLSALLIRVLTSRMLFAIASAIPMLFTIFIHHSIASGMLYKHLITFSVTTTTMTAAHIDHTVNDFYWSHDSFSSHFCIRIRATHYHSAWNLFHSLLTSLQLLYSFIATCTTTCTTSR